MVDYNDGNWHGWNGGECPVHDESEITVKWSCNGVEASEKARFFNRQHWIDAAICAFRVTKAHRKPREWWLYRGEAFLTFDAANEDRQRSLDSGRGGAAIIHVREVLE